MSKHAQACALGQRCMRACRHACALECIFAICLFACMPARFLVRGATKPACATIHHNASVPAVRPPHTCTRHGQTCAALRADDPSWPPA
eukprot:225101-Chlamydomonas_euryale.AAC.8